MNPSAGGAVPHRAIVSLRPGTRSSRALPTALEAPSARAGTILDRPVPQGRGRFPVQAGGCSLVPAESRPLRDAVAWFASPLHAEPSLEDRDGGTDLGRLGQIVLDYLGVHGIVRDIAGW